MSSPPQPSIETKPPINAVAQYLMVLAAVIGCYSLYLTFAVPVIEGPPNQIIRSQIPPNVDLPSAGADKTRLIPLLPQDAWELLECKTLLTSSGTLLFQDFEQRDDGTIQVFPFTLISGLEQKPNSKDKESEAPIIMRCPQGANLKFDKPMRDVFNGGSKIQSARLTGPVDIYRPCSAPNKNDALRILTSNVQIDKQRIFTLDDVLFSFGSNRGSGRNLMIDLAHDSGNRALEDFSNIKGIRRMELAFLDKLRIEATPESNDLKIVGHESDATSRGESATSTRKLFAGTNSPLEITCDGPFVFEFESMTASFQDRVVAQQVDAFQDNIKCEKLLLTFEGIADSKLITDSSKAGSSDHSLGSDLQLKYFVAEGKPAVVTSKSRSAKVSAEYLRFDVLTNRIEARGNPNGKSMVTLVSPDYQMVTQQLSYVIPDDDSLGPMQANGPGRLLRVASGDQDEFFVTWKKSLVTRDDPEQIGLQHVVLDGEARIRIANETRVNADHIELLIWKIPVQTILPNGSIKRSWEYQPAKLYTTGNVTIASAELDGTADTLTASWEQLAKRDSGHPLQASSSSNSGRVGNRNSPTTSQSHAGTDPKGNNPNDPTGVHSVIPEVAQKSDRGPAKKRTFHGQSVDLQFARIGKESELRDLTVVGDVSITETVVSVSPENENAKPFSLKITCERLRLIPQGEENYRALISGSKTRPARIVARDLNLEGVNINLDQAANKLWVEGAGSMKHRPSKPVDKSKPSPQIETMGQKFAPDQLDVSWEGGMIFDGVKLYFEHNVLMVTQEIAKNNRRSKITSFSQGLSVELKTPIKFQDLSGHQKNANFEVRELVLVDHVSQGKQVFQLAGHSTGAAPPKANRTVILNNQTFDSSGKLLEQQKIVVPQATIDGISGSMHAKGPGTIATHRLEKTKSGDAADPFGGLTTVAGKTGLSFIQINFDGDMRVDSQKRQMIVTGNIRTIYTPVQNWQTTHDPDDVQSRRPGSVHLSCERLQLAQWSPRNQPKPTNEMIATGNAHIINDRFDATADRVSYSNSTDMLVIEGTPRSDANLWFKQSANDKNPTHLVAEKIRYRIKDQWTETQGVKNLNINRN